MIWVLLVLVAVVLTPLLIERGRKTMDDTARGAAPGQFAELSRGVTHYTWQGPARGPVIVCIHGLTTPSFVWGGMTRGLALMGFRVLTYDLYGRGFSDRPAGAQDAAFFMGQLDELLAHQRVEGRLTLIGYSMGGAISTCFAAARPDRIRQLVLLAPAGMGIASGKMIRFIRDTPVAGDWLMLAAYPRQLRKGLRAERETPGSVPGINGLQAAEVDFRRFVPAVLASLRGLLSRPLEKEHRAIHAAGIPVLAIWGREDKVIPLSAVGTLAEWSRDARQEVIDGAGHGLTYTHTDQIMALLEANLVRESV